MNIGYTIFGSFIPNLIPELNCPGGGYSYGPKAEDVTFPGVVTTEWTIGSSQEVAWGITANHGGGYLYRLCKVTLLTVSKLLYTFNN